MLVQFPTLFQQIDFFISPKGEGVLILNWAKLESGSTDWTFWGSETSPEVAEKARYLRQDELRHLLLLC